VLSCAKLRRTFNFVMRGGRPGPRLSARLLGADQHVFDEPAPIGPDEDVIDDLTEASGKGDMPSSTAGNLNRTGSRRT
jgi:hypothetical protein